MKPLLPFPFPLNIGTDICQISRIYGILSGPRATRFVNRILAPEEQSRNNARLQILERASLLNDHKIFLASDGKDNQHDELATRDPELWKCATFIAGRFAAKEAAIKAHTYRRLSFHDVVIERRAVEGERLGSGPPIARIKSVEGEEADTSAMVSISHDGDYATAVCLGWDRSVKQCTKGV
ncbi:Fc.00g088010.m01.CDS01 [Cosmosporella sp. VM-42]